jgi:catechol 2,3-dioxygenase-like lactoylglutathione lyase family enzyme
MKLEAVVLPVSDVERAKAFYCAIGFREDGDHASANDHRVVRFTPLGSAASIIFGTGITAAVPGSIQGLVLTVPDIQAAVVALRDRGIDVTDVFHDIGGVFFHASPAFEIPGLDPARRNHASFARFEDPDGNGWVIEEVRS